MCCIAALLRLRQREQQENTAHHREGRPDACDHIKEEADAVAIIKTKTMVKGVSKQDKKGFIKRVQSRLCDDPNSFLSLKDYNAAKKWVRQMDPKHCGKLVDNGHHFLNIMQVALKGANNRPQLESHFEQLRAEKKSKHHSRRFAQAVQSNNKSS